MLELCSLLLLSSGAILKRKPKIIKRYLFTRSKNDVISSVRKHYCALGLGLAEIRFRLIRFRFSDQQSKKVKISLERTRWVKWWSLIFYCRSFASAR